MSADNGIYILESNDGFRVIHAQAIEDLYWWHICCDNPNVVIPTNSGDIYVNEICKNCGTVNPDMEQRIEINPAMLKDYFGGAKRLPTEEEAMKEASRMYEEIMNDDYCPICEYGICVINQWRGKDFPA